MNHNSIFLIASAYRFVIIFLLVIFPFQHQLYGEITPFSFQYFTDYNFFSNFGENKFILVDFIKNYLNIFTLEFNEINNRFPGPIFPFLIKITFYAPNFTILMAVFIIFCELAACYLWSKFLYQKTNYICSLLFSLMPIPLFFGFLHSSDVVFYLISTFFILSIKKFIKIPDIYLIFLLLLLVLTRPAAISYLLFLLIYFLYLNKKILLIYTFILISFSIIYYAPYFVYEAMVLANENIAKGENFVAKVVESKNFFYYFSKFFLLFGFVKSDSGNMYFYLIRCFCATMFIIGFLYSFYKKDTNDVLLMNLTVLPILFFFYPAYRYILPITPLLFMYFFIFSLDIYNYLKKNN